MFLDIGLGIIVAIIAHFTVGVPLSPMLVIGCALLTLLPDVDFLIHLSRGGTTKNDDRHREVLHYPLLYLFIGFAIMSPWNPLWAYLFALCGLLHFIHDSIGIGWGIQWLYPIVTDHFSFFYLYQTPNKERLPKKVLYVWKNKEIEQLKERFGDPNWVQNIYFKFHPFALIEYAGFIGALILLFYLSSR